MCYKSGLLKLIARFNLDGIRSKTSVNFVNNHQLVGSSKSLFAIPYYLFPLLVHRRVTPSIKFAGTQLYAWVEKGTVRVKCLAQEHNTMSPARARTWTARSGEERTNHEATATAPQVICKLILTYLT